MTTRHALVAAPLMPEYDRESGSRRIFDCINYLRETGYDVSFVAHQAHASERYVRMLQQSGVATYIGFDARLEQLVQACQPELAVLAFWHVAEALMPMIRRVSPGTRILVDSIDLHFLRESRKAFQQKRTGTSPRCLDHRFANEMVRELNVYAAADGVLMVSQKEADFVDDLLGGLTATHEVQDAEDLPRSIVPYHKRKGILFIGNFRHAPNVGAVEYLCKDVLSHLDSAILAQHPVYIVGNELSETVRDYARDLPNVNMVGWVPSVLPYLHSARLTVIPLRYGAGTKRKMIQALMTGTPTVSTTIGAEGLNLENGRHVLVADDPAAFAEAIERLLTEEPLWQELAAEGRNHVAALHSREVVRVRLMEVVAKTIDRPAKMLPHGWSGCTTKAVADIRQEVIPGIRQAVTSTLPGNARILVVSRGDESLLQLDGRQAQHFPQVQGGVYAGHHPGTGSEAVEHLEQLRAKGHEYLLFPATSFWWLDYYVELKQHLDACCQQLWSDQSCIIYRLAARRANRPAAREDQLVAADFLEQVRPVVDDRARSRASDGNALRKSVLACGIYMGNQQNTADHIVRIFSECERHAVVQRWVALLGEPATDRVAEVTVRQIAEKTPKFQILNELLGREELSSYDYILITDDDVVLPDGFLDDYLDLQATLGFAIAQPARTSNSYIDHPIVEQQRGVLARQTQFVEIGPVFSFHKSCFELVLPFDLASPMGWGYENVWSRQLAERGLKMGIIDALPVDHSLRKPVANYSWAEADRQRKAYLAKHKHYPLDQCFRVLEVVGFPTSHDRIENELTVA